MREVHVQKIEGKWRMVCGQRDKTKAPWFFSKDEAMAQGSRTAEYHGVALVVHHREAGAV